MGYSSQDILLIVNSDDLGFHPDESDATLDIINYGTAKTASMMVPGSDYERSVLSLKNMGNPPVGLHITMTNEWQEKLPWTTVLPKNEVPSLYNEKGYLWENEILFKQNFNAEEFEREMRAQIEKGIASGLNISHIDAHMGCYYQSKKLFDMAVKIAFSYNLSVISPHPLLNKKKYLNMRLIPVDSFKGFYIIEGEKKSPELRDKTYTEYLKSLTPGIHHLLIHPSYETASSKELMSDIYLRKGDYNFWSGDKVKQLAKELNITFIDYSEIKDLLPDK